MKKAAIGKLRFVYLGAVLLKWGMIMCKDCEARRELARAAFMKAKFREGIKQVAIGAAEAVGLKEKTGLEDSKPVRHRRK